MAESINPEMCVIIITKTVFEFRFFNLNFLQTLFEFYFIKDIGSIFHMMNMEKTLSDFYTKDIFHILNGQISH